MKPVVYLRIASVLTLIHSVLHTIGGVFGKPEPGWQRGNRGRDESQPVCGVRIDAHAISIFTAGWAWAITIVLTAEAIVFWQLGTLAKTDAARLRPIMATFLVAYLRLRGELVYRTSSSGR